MQQIPTPPVPPELPQLPFVVDSGPPITAVIMVIVMVAAIVAWPLVRAFARRLERGSGDAAFREEIEHLRARVAELEPVQQRVLELEERLDFAERLLIQRAPEGLIRGDQG